MDLPWAQKYLIYFWQKNGRLFVCLFVCCNSFFDFGLLLKRMEALVVLKKMIVRNKVFDVRYSLGIDQPLGYSYSADLRDLQRCN